MSLLLEFRGIAFCSVGQGNTVSFWEDTWNFGLLKLEFAQLAFLQRDVQQNFHLPLSLVASQQLVLLEDRLISLPNDEQQLDQWNYIWGLNFTSKQAYKSLMGQSPKVQQLFGFEKVDVMANTNSFSGCSC